MEEIIDADGGEVEVHLPSGRVERVKAPVRLASVKALAIEDGVSRFTLKDADSGEPLTSGMFPYDGNICVVAYHEAKQ